MRKPLRLLGRLVLGVLVLVAVAAGLLYVLTERRITRRYDIPPEPIAIPTDAASIERGRYLVEAITKCTECHGPGLGGSIFVDDPALGRLVASNLTSGQGGIGATYADTDWVRAIRHGVGPGGRALLFMPSEEYHALSDADLGALIAYVKSQPPQDSDLPGNSVGPLGRYLFISGSLPLLPAEMIDHDAPRANPPPRGATKEYGQYLATSGGCVGCHGPGYSGGPIPGAPPDWPPARNITPDEATGIGTWTIADFEIALRAGKRPDGTMLSEAMPWKATAKMSGEDLEALWLFLRSVPPKAAGGR